MSDRRDSEPADDAPTGDEPTVIQFAEGQADDAAPPGEDDAVGDEEEEDDPHASLRDRPYDSEHFHIVAHKLIKFAVMEMLSNNKFDWELIGPFLEAGRDVAHADFQQADIRLHTVRAEGEQWVEAEEAYLGIAVPDRDTGEDWLSETYWLSELAIAEDDPAQVRRIIMALERSIAKMRAWADEKEAGGAAATAPPAEDASA